MSGGQEAKRRGNLGEAAVIAYLRERGWNMVEVNFRSKYGEIDLVAEDGRYLAFGFISMCFFRFFRTISNTSGWERQS